MRILNIDDMFISLKLYRREDPRILRGVVMVWAAVLLIALLWGLIHIGYRWKSAVGYEHVWIAESIEAGHGFSLPFKLGIYSDQPEEQYYTTAHEEPVYPFLMAFLLKIFGPYGRPIMLMLQVTTLFLTSVIVYYLGRKVFNHATGLLAGFVVSVSQGPRYLAESYYGPSVFAGLLVSICALLIIRCAERPTFRRGVLLGLSLGFCNLLYAPTLFFLPLALFFLIYKSNSINAAVKTAAVVLVSCIMVVSVWTARNYFVFGQIVPVRTNMGRSLCLFNPVLAETFFQGAVPGSREYKPYWKARDAQEATLESGMSIENQKAIYLRGYEIVKEDAPPDFESYNEAEIDKLYFKKGAQFILAEPGIFIELTYYRLKYFFFSMGWKNTVISVCFFIGAILSVRNRKAIGLSALVAAYLVPYSLAIAWWYRYRYPIEPVMLMFAVYLPVLIVSKFCTRVSFFKAKGLPA